VSYKKIGDEVAYGDILCRFDFGEELSILQDDEDSIFDDIKYSSYKADHPGIISDIQVFYTSDEMTDSIKKFITTVTKNTRKRERLTKDAENAKNYSTQLVPVDTKIKGITVSEQDVLIVYYITTDTNTSLGDKVVLDSSLKSVAADITNSTLETEDGEKIDIIFGGKSIFNRIILSPLRVGILDNILEKAERNITDLYFEQ
jgi:hypothetical protein